MGFWDGKPNKCGEPVAVTILVPGGFWDGTKKVPKTMPCTRPKGHWGQHDPTAKTD